ncbi:MAG: leucyl aminopeptidase family protein [Bdellovibrionales bacterium]|nr:leucyl aminopeptidase family protein [Bdellovibrionales bacterium]
MHRFSVPSSWLNKSGKSFSGGCKVTFIGREQKTPKSLKIPNEQKKELAAGSPVVSWTTTAGSHWCLQAKIVESGSHYGFFSPSPFAMARDLVGGVIRQILSTSQQYISLEYVGDDEEEWKGACVGIEMAHYNFKNYWPMLKPETQKISVKSTIKNYKDLVKQAAVLGEAVNMARYLVDLPANILNPKTYADFCKSHFSKTAKTKVTVWDEARLRKEGMGLHIAVGQGALHGPRLVHIQYRGAAPKEKAIAIVGKGITFDSGGLDIKPSSGMRLMKKDMGGSASVIGLAHYIVSTKAKINCDFYVALAENAVSKDSFRPGDILVSRSGHTVEIHNTDAEGRLVLGDALSVAREQQPKMIIDIATLTGAIKVGLGAGTPGLFSNDDNLAETLLRSGQAMGDGSWRMPLVPEEKAKLKSDIADMVNSVDGFGGAITAAWFLNAFTGGIPWAHFDIYAWKDKGSGVYQHSGGSGQMVQAISHFLDHL